MADFEFSNSCRKTQADVLDLPGTGMPEWNVLFVIARPFDFVKNHGNWQQSIGFDDKYRMPASVRLERDENISFPDGH